MSGDTLPAGEIVARARRVLDAHWQPEGYTVPSTEVYPHQWLWDSCFHAIAWAHLGDADRALTELHNVFAHQADDGFVPHMTYWRAPDMHADFWGRRHTSCITQPPMFGHAIAELVRLGIGVDAELVERAGAGLDFFIRYRRRADGIVIVHPWESGCDDSPRWDSWCTGPWDPERWKAVKGDLVASLVFHPLSGSPVANPGFEVAASGFEALVAFNVRELAGVDPTSPTTIGISGGVVDRAVQPPKLRGGGGARSTVARTLEARLGVLVDDDRADATFAEVRDPEAFGGACGPAQVHRAEPAFAPAQYWRGATWPQLSYLLWVAARRLGRDDDATYLREAMLLGATRSGFAEYWDPDTGDGYGAVPQSWTALAAVVALG